MRFNTEVSLKNSSANAEKNLAGGREPYKVLSANKPQRVQHSRSCAPFGDVILTGEC